MSKKNEKRGFATSKISKATVPVDIAAKKARKKRKNGDESSTNVFITINTNLKPTAAKDRKAAKATLESCMDAMLSDADGLDEATTWYTEGGFKAGKVIPNQSFSDDALVLNVTSEYVVETEGRFSSIHSHALVRVKHTGTLFFDRNKIGRYVKRFFDSSSCPVKLVRPAYVFIKLLGNPNEGEAVQNYMFKELVEDAEAHKLKNKKK